MRRSYGYTATQDSGSDYHAHLSRVQRMPTMDPRYPIVHKAFNNKYTFEEEVEFQEEHQRKQHTPKSQKKVQVVENVETIEETRDENYEDYEEATVDVHAEGFITQKHKGFELQKWKTFKH